MTTFTYTITDEVGIHARPAGLLKKKANSLGSTITLTASEETVDVTKTMKLMALGVKCGDTVTISVEGGENEAGAAAEMEKFFNENL